jgi:DNA-binding CsgD family transcriptional regulator
MQQALTQVTEVLEGLDHGVVVLGRGGRVQMMTRRARQWLGEYFGAAAPQASRLPDTLRRWVRAQDGGLAQADAIGPPRQPLVVEQEGKQLRVRMLSEPGQNTLLLEERRIVIEPKTLERFGLSRREAEVLAWVAEGKTNSEIGTILSARPRTVAKHLERIYQKLGVENRTAAALAATSGPESGATARRPSLGSTIRSALVPSDGPPAEAHLPSRWVTARACWDLPHKSP